MRHHVLKLAWLALAAFSGSRGVAQVRICQYFGGGGGIGATFASDYVEVVNTGAPQLLTGWSLQYATPSGSTWIVTQLPPITLATGQALLVKQADGSTLPEGQTLALPAPDAFGSVPMSATDAKLALVSSLTPLVGGQPTYATHPALVDFVGIGPQANWNETAAAGGAFSASRNARAPSNSTALFRFGCGAADSQDNALDFEVGLPQPRNTAVAPTAGLTAAVLASPLHVLAQQSALVRCQPYACGSLIEEPALVVIDLTAIGGPSSVNLVDDGTSGDEFAGDGLYSRSVTVGAATTPGTKHLPITLTGATTSGGAWASLLVTPVSAPGHDNCATAIAVGGPYSPPVALTHSFSGAHAESNVVLSSSTTNPGNMSSRRGVWYSVIGTGSTLTADTCASSLIGGTTIPDTIVMVFGGTCDSLTIVGNNDDVGLVCGAGSGVERRSRVSWCSEAGASYFVFVAPFSAGPQTFLFTLTISDDGSACSGAALTGACVPTLAPGLLEHEPAFGVANDDGCDSSAQQFRSATPATPAQRWIGRARSVGSVRDVDWYRFQAATNELLLARLTAQFNGLVEIRALGASGDCSSNVLLAASPIGGRCAETSAVAQLVAGTWYAVRVVPASNLYPGALSTVFGGVLPGAFGDNYTLDLELGTPPPNDECSTATVIGPGSASASFDTRYATPLDASAPGSTCQPSQSRDTWFAWTSQGAGTASVSTCAVAPASSDTVITVYTGACGNLTEVACDDDGCASPGAASAVSFQVECTTSYTIRVSSRAATPGGQWTLDIVAPGIVDTDGDGVNDCLDGCPSDPNKQAPGICGCGVSDVDTDGDGTADCLDGCPSDPNKQAPGQCGCGVADTDTDGDGAADCVDGCPLDPLKIAPGQCGCGVSDLDTDGDGTADCNDLCPLDPLKIAPGICGCGVSDVDTDGDGTADCFDGCPLDPLKIAPGACGCGVPDVDTDGDGTLDCFDGCPLDPLKLAPGICGCGVSDLDTDGDGTPDCNDGCPLDPNKLAPGQCGCGVADTDTDGDGTADCIDLCPLDPLKIAPGQCGCGVADTDTDGDGTADCIDLCPLDPLKIAPGQCGCGVADTDTDGDGTADCNDQCPLDPSKIAPGICGCGVSDVDTDGDGLADCVDNCAALPNPAQADCDFDGIGDACEIAAGAFDTNGNGIPDACEGGVVLSYCTAGTTTNGCNAMLTGVGTPSVAQASGFVLTCTSIEGQKPTLLFYGITGPSANSWSGTSTSFLCVKSPAQRIAVANSNGTPDLCDGSYSVDFLAYAVTHPNALGMPLSAGLVVNAQVWFRDPPAPKTTNLSDGCQFTTLP
jgi:hypothetical protein